MGFLFTCILLESPSFFSLTGIASGLLFQLKQSITFIAEEKAIPVLDNITAWIDANKISILNFIYNIPNTLKTVFANIKIMFNNLIKNGGIEQVLESIGTILIEVFRQTLLGIADMFKAVFENISISTGFSIYGSIMNGLNQIIDDIKNNPILSVVFGVAKMVAPPALKGALTLNGITFDKWSRIDSKDKNKINDEVSKASKDATTAIKNASKNIADTTKKEFKDIYSVLSDGTADITSNWEDLPENLLNALDLGFSSTSTGSSTSSGNSAQDNGLASIVTGTETAENQFTQIFSMMGDFGAAINQMITGISNAAGWIGILIKLIGALVSDLGERSKVVRAFLDGFSMLAKLINTDTVVRFTENILAPIMNLLQSVGMLLGSFGDTLALIMPAVNMLGYVINAIAKVIDTVAMVIHNAIAWICNHIPFLDDMDYYEKGDFKDLWTDWGSPSEFTSPSLPMPIDYYDLMGNSSNAGSSYTSGTAASYTAQKDIVVNVTYSQSFVNGDATEIALAIRDEIRKAERLGY